jgi:hypothetical protein
VELLPDPAERENLLDQLAALIALEGAEAFLTGAIIEPSDRSFPDPWTPDADGVERLIRRLLGYAGLAQLDLTIELDRFSDAQGEVLSDGSAGGHSGTAAWFAGIRGGVCAFGVDTHQLHDPVGLIGTLAHEVAHAYRSAYDLRDADHAIEERLTDLTTIYLGFGILTVNASQRFESGRQGAGGSWYRHSERGYLAMQAMSFLLAAQNVARGDPPAPIARALAPNQRACFKAACKQLGARDALLARLGVQPLEPPPRSEIPRPRGWFRRWFTS